MSLEKTYKENTELELRKKLGQFFTPEVIADLMADWLIQAEPKKILDPSVGTGVLARSLAKKLKGDFELIVHDIDENIMSYFLREPLSSNISLNHHVSDFLESNYSNYFDAVIMNPPYIRHHEISYKYDIFEKISILSGHKIPNTSNLYVLFCITAILSLKEGGCGAFIIPSEWVNSNFGRDFKDFLLSNGYLKEIIYFSNCSTIFEDALTTACILLIKKDGQIDPLSVYYLENKKIEEIPTTFEEFQKKIPHKVFLHEILNKTQKWNHLFRHGIQDEIPGLIPLSTFGRSKRGIATGANKYFLVSQEDAENISNHHLKPCIGKTTDINGIIFTWQDYLTANENNSKINLIDFKEELSESELTYIEEGEKQGLHKRYLLSKRKPWYTMEQREAAPIWASVFSRKKIKFIYNEAMILNLTTFHGFYLNEGYENYAMPLVACLNSSRAQELAMANIRVYGGGLLKFEPRDLLHLLVPDLRLLDDELLNRLSELVLNNANQNEIDDLVDQVFTITTE